jgi:maltose O-acetyltransferase
MPIAQTDRASERGRGRSLAERASRSLALFAYYGFVSRLPCSNFPGGELYRRARELVCRRFFLGAGSGINVEAGVFVADGANISIGDGSGIGAGSRVYGGKIGADVMLGPGVVLLKDNHLFGDVAKPIKGQGRTETAVPIIEDWAWIGERAIILPGRRVGKGAVVGAGAVVTKDVDPFEIVAGNPARPVASRAPAGQALGL